MKSETPKKIDKVKWALYRTVTAPQTVAKAKWVMYGAVALSTVLMFAVEGPTHPKVPPAQGD